MSYDAIVVGGGHNGLTCALDMVGAEHFPEEVVTDMRRYRTRGGSVKINMVLSEPPRYPVEELLRTGVAICPSIDHLERAWQDAVRGEPAAGPYIEVEVPTAVDPSLTDDGSCVMTMFTQYGPWHEDGWPAGAREAYAERCLDILAQHAPQGEQGLDQMTFMRPSPLLAQYATPVDGLYLCGAGTHPGGGVMGACGHNAAQRVLRDRRSLRARLSAARASARGASRP